MKEYKRRYASFSLCGLNCCLCPRYQIDGSSKCPGCGGEDFSIKHPSCRVITCNEKQDNVEFCFECSLYPCKKYQEPSKVDSFISYKNVLQNFADAKFDLENYLKNLKEKQEILLHLIENYNDGRSKGFYCIAIDILPLTALNDIMENIENNERLKNTNTKEKALVVTALIKEKANDLNLELTLRKSSSS